MLHSGADGDATHCIGAISPEAPRYRFFLIGWDEYTIVKCQDTHIILSSVLHSDVYESTLQKKDGKNALVLLHIDAAYVKIGFMQIHFLPYLFIRKIEGKTAYGVLLANFWETNQTDFDAVRLCEISTFHRECSEKFTLK